MEKFERLLNKPEYVYNPKQLMRRLLRFIESTNESISETKLFGSSFYYLPKEDIGKAIHTYGLYDLSVSEVLWRLTGKNDFVCDIGANIGYFSCLLSKKVGDTGKVYCFEPNPHVHNLLEKNINRSSNIKLFKNALSDSTQKLDLFAPKQYGDNQGLATLSSDGGTKIAEIQTITLDSLNIRPSIFKIDVEGHELQVLKGAKNTLQYVNNIVFEDHNIFSSEVKQLLEQSGFNIYYIRKHFSGLELTTIYPDLNISKREPPNFLATKWDQQTIEAIFKNKAWLFLRQFQQ